MLKDKANVRNQNGFTALDVVDHCPNRDLKTMKIREFLLQAGVPRSVCVRSDPKPKSPGNNRIFTLWEKYLKADGHTWFPQVVLDLSLFDTYAYIAINQNIKVFKASFRVSKLEVIGFGLLSPYMGSVLSPKKRFK